MKIQDYLPYFTCAGVIGVAVLSGNATLNAEKILREKNLEDAPIQDKAKETWKYYIPVVAACGLTIASVIATKRLNAKELATVTAACGYLAQKGSAVTREIIDRTNNEVAAEVIKDAEAADVIKGGKVEFTGQIIEDTGNGKLLCIEGYSGRLFWSSEEAVRDAVRKFNELYAQDKYVCLNDFYEILGLETSYFGHKFGWAYGSDFYGEEPLDIQVETVMDKKKHVPICCIDIYTYPMECWQEV